jgi:hypothetical protein
MAYEVFKRTGVRVEQPALALTPDGRIALNATATRVLVEAEVKTVLLLWDSENHKVAIKPVPKGDKNAYTVSLVSDISYAPGHSCRSNTKNGISALSAIPLIT